MSEAEWRTLCLHANRLDLVNTDPNPSLQEAAAAAIKEIEILRKYIADIIVDYNRLLRCEKSRFVP